MLMRYLGSLSLVLCLIVPLDGRLRAVHASTDLPRCAIAVMAVDLSLPAESTGQLQRWHSDTNPWAECPSQPAWVLYDTIVKSVLANSGELAAALQERSEAVNLAVGLERVLDAVRRAAEERAGATDLEANSAGVEARAVLFANALVSGESPEATDQNRRWLRHVLLPDLENVGLSLMMVMPAGGDEQILEALREADAVQLLTLDSAGQWQRALSDWIASSTPIEPVAVAQVADEPAVQEPAIQAPVIQAPAATAVDTPTAPVVTGDPSVVANPAPAATQIEGGTVSVGWWLLLLGGVGVVGIGIWRWLQVRRSLVTGSTDGASVAQPNAVDEATQTVLMVRPPATPAPAAELTSTEKLPPRDSTVVKPAPVDDTLDTSQSGRTVSRYRPLHEGPGGGSEGDLSENLSAWDMPADRFERD